ncbi:MAG TPA: hypothetical protein VEI97_10395 [bacterium]|nr:hypothetical protein [bacterium]
MHRWFTAVGLVLATLALGACNGGEGFGGRNAEVDLNFEGTGTLRGRVVPLEVQIAPESRPGDTASTTARYALALTYSRDNVTFLPATLLSTPGAETNIVPLDDYPVGQTTTIALVWDRERDIPDARASVHLRLTATREATDGPIAGSITKGPRVLDFGALAPCTMAAPRITSGTINVPRNQTVDVALAAQFGDPPLTWSINEPLQGGLTLNPTGRITGTTTASTPATQVRLFTVADNCSGRQDQAWLTVRVQ